MAEHLGAEWKNFRFKMTQKEDYDKILEHLRNSFYKDEPFCKALGDSPVKNADFDALALNNMEKYGLSFVVLDNETEKVAGVTVISRKERNSNLSDLFEKLKSTEMRDKLLPFLLSMRNKTNIFEKYTDIDHYATLSIISVDKDFRGKGLASEMTDRAIAMLRAKGFPLVEATFTSPHTRKIAVSKGFQELTSKFLRDFTGENGDVVLSGATNEDLASFMALKL